MRCLSSFLASPWIHECSVCEPGYIDAVGAVVTVWEAKKYDWKLIYQFCCACSRCNETHGQVSCWHCIHRYVMLNDDCSPFHMDVTHKLPNIFATCIQTPNTIYCIYRQTTPKKIAEWQFSRPGMNKMPPFYICTAAHNPIWETRSKNTWNSKNNYFASFHPPLHTAHHSHDHLRFLTLARTP